MDSSPANKALTKTRFSDLKPPLSSDIMETLFGPNSNSALLFKPRRSLYAVVTKNFAVDAETGSGKTLAFVIPLVEIIRKSASFPPKRHQVMGVIISPTLQSRGRRRGNGNK